MSQTVDDQPASEPEFLIVTALEIELAAVHTALERSTFVSPEIVVGSVPSFYGGDRRVMAALTTRTGSNPASGQVRALLAQHASIRTVVMVGIAAGCPDPVDPERHVRLGDVVMLDLPGVVQVDFGKYERSTDDLPTLSPRPFWIRPAPAFMRAARRVGVEQKLGE